jgi:hypothetical protein
MKVLTKMNKIIFGLILFFAISLIPSLVKAGTSGCVDLSLGVSYQYVGYDDYVTYNDCPAAVSYDSSTHYFTPKTGFKIIDPATDYNGRLYAFNPSGMTIQWTGDEKLYGINYTISPEPRAGTVGPLGCEGGTYVTTDCDPASGYRVKTCPFSEYGYICPGYDPQSIATGGYLDSIGVEFEPYRPDVTVYGKDVIREIDRQTVQMTVPHPTEGQNNADIYWETEDVTRCECTTSTGVDCTPLVGTTYSTFIGESIQAKDSPFSLTSDETFSVECW